jgi:hypothetical protein
MKTATKNTPTVRQNSTISVPNISSFVEEFDDDDLKAQLEDDASVGDRKSFFKMKDKNIVRLCPKRAGAKVMYKEMYRHGIMDPGNGQKFVSVRCVAKDRPPGRCYICEVVDTMRQMLTEQIRRAERERNKQKVESLNKALKDLAMNEARWGAYWNVIDMANPEAGAALAWFSSTIHNYIKKETGLKNNEIEKRPWSIEDGFALAIDKAPPPAFYECRFLDSEKYKQKYGGRLDDECYQGMADLEAVAAPLPPKELFAIAHHMASNYNILSKMDWDEELRMFGYDSNPDAGANDVFDDDEEDEVPVLDVKKAKVEPVKRQSRSKVEDTIDIDDDEDIWEVG